MGISLLWLRIAAHSCLHSTYSSVYNLPVPTDDDASRDSVLHECDVTNCRGQYCNGDSVFPLVRLNC